MLALRNSRFLLLTLLLAALLVACGDDDDDNNGTEDMVTDVQTDNGDDVEEDVADDTVEDTEDDATDMADVEDDTADMEDDMMTATGAIRVIHLSPDAPNVDVYANGSEDPAITDLAFPDGTPYIDLPAASYTFDVAPTGTSLGDSVLNVADFTIAADTKYTVAAIDEVANITALALTDDDADIPAGSFRVRAIHAAPAVGQVDIWDVTDAQNPALLYENVDFGVAGEPADLPAGTYTVGVDLDDDMTPDAVFDLPELTEGYINLFATNDDTDAVFLNAQLSDGSTVRIDPNP